MPLAGAPARAQNEEVECDVCLADDIGPLMAQDHADEDPVEDLFGPDDESVLPPVLEGPAEDVNVGKPKRHPGNPTNWELGKHNLTHANYRSWCAICNGAALKEDQHYRQTAKKSNKRQLTAWALSTPQLASKR